MESFDVIVAKLASDIPDKRYEACEELRVAPWLTGSAIAALERALHDSSPLVSDAARRALAVHKPHSVTAPTVTQTAVEPHRSGGPIGLLFDFSGKAGRLQFITVQVVAAIAEAAVKEAVLDSDERTLAALLSMLAYMVCGIIELAAAVRRAHDLGHSGRILLVGLIPILGFILPLYLLLVPGKEPAPLRHKFHHTLR